MSVNAALLMKQRTFSLIEIETRRCRKGKLSKKLESKKSGKCKEMK